MKELSNKSEKPKLKQAEKVDVQQWTTLLSSNRPYKK